MSVGRGQATMRRLCDPVSQYCGASTTLPANEPTTGHEPNDRLDVWWKVACPRHRYPRMRSAAVCTRLAAAALFPTPSFR
jgi:hypothetical protein